MNNIGLTFCVVFYAVSWGVAQDAFFLADAHRAGVTSARIFGAQLLTIGEQEKKFLVDPQGAFWRDYLAKGRFNEESCAPTHRPFTPVDSPDIEILAVKEGDTLEFEGLKLHVLETPGRNPGAARNNPVGICEVMHTSPQFP